MYVSNSTAPMLCLCGVICCDVMITYNYRMSNLKGPHRKPKRRKMYKTARCTLNTLLRVHVVLNVYKMTLYGKE